MILIQSAQPIHPVNPSFSYQFIWSPFLSYFSVMLQISTVQVFHIFYKPSKIYLYYLRAHFLFFIHFPLASTHAHRTQIVQYFHLTFHTFHSNVDTPCSPYVWRIDNQAVMNFVKKHMSLRRWFENYPVDIKVTLPSTNPYTGTPCEI